MGRTVWHTFEPVLQDPQPHLGIGQVESRLSQILSEKIKKLLQGRIEPTATESQPNHYANCPQLSTKIIFS